MNERMKILEMLSAGKIKAEEAEALLKALEECKGEDKLQAKQTPKFLCVQVEPKNPDGDKVNVRVPLGILRAGVKLTALIPSDIQKTVNSAIHDKGINVDLSKLDSSNMDELIAALSELSVDVDNKSEKVRICCQ